MFVVICDFGVYSKFASGGWLVGDVTVIVSVSVSVFPVLSVTVSFAVCVPVVV